MRQVYKKQVFRKKVDRAIGWILLIIILSLIIVTNAKPQDIKLTYEITWTQVTNVADSSQYKTEIGPNGNIYKVYETATYLTHKSRDFGDDGKAADRFYNSLHAPKFINITKIIHYETWNANGEWVFKKKKDSYGR